MSVKAAAIFSEEAARKSVVSVVDRLGICVSVACAVHCLAMPVLLALLPTMSSIFLIGHGVEAVLAIAAVVLAIACLCWGFRIHRKKRLILSFSAAAAFILWGQSMGTGWVETLLVVLGGLGLVGSHLLNRALCRSCNRCCSHGH